MTKTKTINTLFPLCPRIILESLFLNMCCLAPKTVNKQTIFIFLWISTEVLVVSKVTKFPVIWKSQSYLIDIRLLTESQKNPFWWSWFQKIFLIAIIFICGVLFQRLWQLLALRLIGLKYTLFAAFFQWCISKHKNISIISIHYNMLSWWVIL